MKKILVTIILSVSIYTMGFSLDEQVKVENSLVYFINGNIKDLDDIKFIAKIPYDSKYKIIESPINDLVLIHHELRFGEFVGNELFFFAEDGTLLNKTNIYSGERVVKILEKKKLILFPPQEEHAVQTDCIIINYQGKEISKFNKPRVGNDFYLTDDEALIIFYRIIDRNINSVDFNFITGVVLTTSGEFIDNVFLSDLKNINFNYDEKEYTLPFIELINLPPE